jgi:hypothetical protein
MAATMYKLDDFRPFLYKTSDYGATWKKIVSGIPNDDFTRVIREDPNRRGLLVAGSETHLYISYDDGENWKQLQLNLPVIPITDIAFHKREDDLVVATQGRSFYVLDDMPMVRQLGAKPELSGTHLYQPKDAYRLAGNAGPVRAGGAEGQNPANGMVIYYWLKEKPKADIALEFLDASGKLVKKFSSKEVPREGAQAGSPGEEEEGGGGAAAVSRAPAEAGMNRFVWDMRYMDATRFPGLIMWAGNVRGPRVVPGKYQVRLTVDGESQTQPITVKKDPRTATTPEDFQKQLALGLQIRDKLSQANGGVIQIREVKRQLEKYASSDNKTVADAAKSLTKQLAAVEEELYQTKNQSNQDPLNFPIKLNNKLAALANVVSATDVAPTSQSTMVYEDLATAVNAQVAKVGRMLEGEVAEFNKLVREQGIPAVVVKKGAE